MLWLQEKNNVDNATNVADQGCTEPGTFQLLVLSWEGAQGAGWDWTRIADLNWPKGYYISYDIMPKKKHLKYGGELARKAAAAQGLAGHWSTCGEQLLLNHLFITIILFSLSFSILGNSFYLSPLILVGVSFHFFLSNLWPLPLGVGGEWTTTCF